MIRTTEPKDVLTTATVWREGRIVGFTAYLDGVLLRAADGAALIYKTRPTLAQKESVR